MEIYRLENTDDCEIVQEERQAVPIIQNPPLLATILPTGKYEKDMFVYAINIFIEQFKKHNSVNAKASLFGNLM